jgi:predicted kinase
LEIGGALVSSVDKRGIVVLSGPPCAGKSSIAKLLLGAPAPTRRVYIEVDALFDLLFPESDRNRDNRMLAYDAAHLLARGLFERGLMPILECTYARAQQRRSLVAALADVPTAPLWVVEIEIRAEEAVHRFTGRVQATDLDEGVVRERAEGFPYGDQALRLRSSASSPPDVLAGEIADWLRKPPRPVERERWAEAGRDWGSAPSCSGAQDRGAVDQRTDDRDGFGEGTVVE